MGDSAKLPNPDADTYRFTTHCKYLDTFIDAVIGRSESIVLVVHDWGSALGFDWANRHRDRIRGVAYMEAIVRPVASWDEWSAQAVPIFQGFRSDKGEAMILDRNMFVERVLPGSVLRKLTEAEMAEYRRPYPKAEDRWPTLTWPRQIPIAGEPADVVAIAADYSQWMAQNDIPKLFVNAEPGAILIGAPREFCRSWKNQTEVTVPGSHFIQEDSGPAIGRAVAGWIKANSL
jgi:haloalkane dehalogenase